MYDERKYVSRVSQVMFTIQPYLPPPPHLGKKSLNHCRMGRLFQLLKQRHHGHNYNTFSLSLTTVNAEIQKNLIILKQYELYFVLIQLISLC